MSFKLLKSARALTRHIGSAALVAASICVAAVSAWAAGPLSSIDDVRVGPLLTTHWAQGDAGGQYCYNYYTPLHRVCGCTATALGQVMYYHKYPTERILPGEYLYDTIDDYGRWWVFQDGTGGMTNTTSGAYTEFDPPYGGPYEWSKMVDSPTGSTPADSRAAIGRLTRDAGLAVFSHYFTGETSGFTDAVASSVILNLHYADAVKTGFNAGKLIANLDAGLPVLLNLTSHAVVADGYGYQDDKLYIHINYGYSGSSDGWYDTTTDVNGKNLESMVANIFPPTLGARHSSVISGRVLDTSGNPIANATVTATGATNVTTTSSANGTYAFILPAGNYTFAASKSGAAGSSATTVAASEQKTRAEGDGWGTGVNNSASGVDVTVYTESDFAKSWSNNANDGRFDNPQNWTGGTLPASGEAVAVFASGDTVISSETAMTVGTVSVPSGTVRFSGSGAVITLGGLNLLSVGSTVEITGREGLSDGSIKGVGTLVVNPGAGNTYTMPQNNGGNAVPFDAAYFWGEAVIKSGTVKFGNIWSFGSRRDNDDNRQIPTVRVKGGATLDENGLSTGDYNGEILRVILEEGATLKSTGNSSSGLTSLFLEGNATVDTSSGKVVACYGYDCGYYPVWVNLGTNTLTKVGTGQFYLSACEFTGTGTFDVQQGEVRVKIDGWNWYPTSTLEDGTLRIRSGATFTLENRGDNPTHFTAKDLVLDGTIARTAANCVFTVTGTVTGSGTAAALTLAQGAVFKPSGAGYLTITDSLSGVFELDMSGVDLSGAQDIPLVSVPSALADGVRFAPATIPEGWSVLRVPENDNVRYLLIEGEAVEMPASPTPTAFSVGQQTVVTLTCATEGATIYYTTDGSDPTTSSTAYSAPFTVTDGTTVKARACKTGWRDSLIYIATFTYVPPATLTHRWSFNGTTDAQCLADSVGNATATKYYNVTWNDGKAVVASTGSKSNAGYLDLGTGVLGSGDATLEVWYEKLENPASWSYAFGYAKDDGNQFSVATAYGYNQEYGGNTGSQYAPMYMLIGGEYLACNGGDRVGIEPLLPNLPQHISITFKTNGDGSTTVRAMSRDAITGFLLRDKEVTIASWTLAQASDFKLSLGRCQWGTFDIKSRFDEVRTWNGVLSDEQLSANAFAGPDAPVGGRESAFSTGFDIAAGSTFTIGKEGMFRTDGSVGVGTGASIVFDTANFSGTEMKFVTGGFSLPAGASSVLDFVTLTDSSNYVARVENGTITVASAQPAYAKWIGASAPASMDDLTNAVNWTCYGKDGTTVVADAVPGPATTLIIDGTTSFTLPVGLSPTWGAVLVGGHAAPHYGRIASTGGDNNWITFRGRPNTDYTPCGEKAVSYLDRTSGNSPSDLGGSQLRFDGWIYVSAEQAGRWDIRCNFDDMIAFSLDGEWQFTHNTWRYGITAGSYVSEGWHRFTLIVRDTGGGWGAGTLVNGKNYPFAVSINGGAELGFSQLTFGADTTDATTVTLAADCDWSALGEINFANGVVLDLNGHNLKLNDFTTDSFGSMVTNSAAQKAIMYFTKETSESKAVASGMIKEVDVKIILAKDGDQIATWTGAANDGDPENPNNWENLAGEPVLPTADYTVKISGNNVNFQSASSIACKAFEIGTCTFTADCDWRGLYHTPSILGEANLNGHNLYLARLNAVGGSFVNNAADTTSRVLFDVPSGADYGVFSEQLFIDNISSLSTGENVFLSLMKPDDSGDTTFATQMLLGKTANVAAEFVQTSGTVSLGDSVNKFGDSSGHRGVYTMYDGTLMTGDGSEFVIGANGNGTFNLSGGDVTIGQWISVGRFSGGNGTFNMTGGTLTMNKNCPLWLGGDAPSTGVFNFGGTAEATFNGIDIGRFSQGTLNMNGGTLTVNRGDGFNVGRDGVGIVVQSNGTLNVNTTFRLAWGSGGSVSGTYTLNGGTVNVIADAYWGEGRSGTFVQNGGTMNANNGVNLAVGGNASANLTLAGGVFNTKFFNRGSGTANITFNGGTVAALENTSTFFRGIPSVNVGAGGMTFDTAGRTVEISDLGMNASAGSSFTKAGSGKLTMDTLPPTESVVVSNGTFALKSAQADSSHPALTHRWSFTGGSLADTVGGSTATTVGSALTFADNAVTMSGNGSGTGSLRLGNGLVSGNNVTFEFWARHDATKSWSPVFEYGIDNNNEIALTWEYKRNDFSWPTMFFYTNGHGNYTECWWSSQWLFEDHKMLHIVVRIETGEDGKAVVTTIVRSAENPSAEAKVWTQPAPDGWTLARLANSGVFCLGGSLCGDPDANATYDEVRIWNGALSNGEIANSFAKGPDATAADLEAIFAPDGAAPSVVGAVAVAWGGTLDLGRNDLTREYVSGGGTVINGTLTASKELRAKLGDCLTISSGATFNIDGAKAAFSAEDIASLATKPKTYTLVKVANGGTIEGSLLQPATDAALPTGWHVIQTSGAVTLRKNGVTIHIR